MAAKRGTRTSLDWGSNGITDKGALALIKALYLAALAALNLAHNKLSPESMSSL